MTYKNITHRDYKHYQAKYNNTVPIRGRAEDVRPIGERRRTGECITMKKYPCGQVSYCATLYNTDVVEYHNNGQITLRTNGWQTPSTAEFMHEHSPFTVWKQDNKLWARVATPEGVKAYPIGESLTFEMVDGAIGAQFYEPINKVLINKRVVDRAKAKAAREPLQPFLTWCKSFLAMSDGWVMHETRKEVIPFVKLEGYEHSYFDYPHTANKYKGGERLLEALSYAEPDDYLKLMCCVLNTADHLRSRVAESFTSHAHGRVRVIEYFDQQYQYEVLHRMVYGLVTKHGDIYTTVQVEPTHKAIGNTV